MGHTQHSKKAKGPNTGLQNFPCQCVMVRSHLLANHRKSIQIILSPKENTLEGQWVTKLNWRAMRRPGLGIRIKTVALQETRVHVPRRLLSVSCSFASFLSPYFCISCLALCEVTALSCSKVTFTTADQWPRKSKVSCSLRLKHFLSNSHLRD